MANTPSLTDVNGIGAVAASALRKAGVKTPASLAKATVERIAAIPGFGVVRAAAVIKAAAALSKTATEAEKGREDKKAGKKKKKSKKSKKGKKKKKKGDKKKKKKGRKKK